MIAEVAFNLPIEKTFHYLIPEAPAPALQPGMRVLAPFGPRERLGFVVKVLSESPVRELKTIRRVLDPLPVIARERWALASWLSDHYCCSLGEALAAMVPSTLRVPVTGQGSRVKGEGKGVESASTPFPSTLHPSPHLLTAAQERALRAIHRAIDQRRPRTLLLHGVTGSGKTELYLQAIRRVLEQGRSAICLLPEIALTPQTLDWFTARFGAQVAVWHSRLTSSQRAIQWSRIAAGLTRIVVGARSAVFAPVERLGLVILDEEHEASFKQADSPRYHARDAAQERARLTDAVVVLGSATPSVESYYAALQDRSGPIVLPERVAGRALPKVDVIDMREEFRHRRGAEPLSGRLQLALQQVVDRHEQAMLLLNRRGFARVVQCKTCGVVERCPKCAVPLIYHAAGGGELVCHYCSHREPPIELCPACRTGYLRFRGAGTERVESELHRLFPVAAIARMDRDTTRRRDSHRELYEAVKGGTVSLLVGTQMIAKGLDFPQVTLVGVVSADTALNLPDFRAGERTFDLLTQVAGRAGRGDQPGRVLIQTYCPDHYAIQAARRHDYRAFYAEEIAMRRRLRLPPFTRLVELIILGSPKQRVEEAARMLAERLRSGARRKRIVILGPAPARVSRLRRAYRMSLVLKGRSVEPITALLREALEPGRKFRGLPVIVDVDPL
ncbi:MAG: primosomal protein N' [Omnitrophica WOR_2 bacterium RIFCSPHIGHO2_02_FULL_68_15]|nr:MAG: primosomal protein N' [Omnitrophica WOR_2 bacterium RIFCSPHIGHO2_02_FULL_68_15]